MERERWWTPHLLGQQNQTLIDSWDFSLVYWIFLDFVHQLLFHISYNEVWYLASLTALACCGGGQKKKVVQWRSPCLQHAATTCDWGFPVFHDFSWCQRLCLKFRKWLIDDDFGVTGNSETEQHEATHRYDQIGFRYQGYLIGITWLRVYSRCSHTRTQDTANSMTKAWCSGLSWFLKQWHPQIIGVYK